VALEEYLTALRLEPDSATAHYNLACFLSAHAFDFAVAEYKEAIELEPDYPDAHLNLGLTYADLGQNEDASRELRTAVELEPADALPRQELAGVLMDSGDFRNAITQLKEVARLEPENFDAWLDLGICYAQKGFYAEAERAYESAKALKGDDLLLTYNLGALYALWERPKEALEQLKKAVAIDRAKVAGWLAADPMFDSLKGDPEFEALT
jgi:Flp pilus assembly protein TadD